MRLKKIKKHYNDLISGKIRMNCSERTQWLKSDLGVLNFSRSQI